MALPVDLTNLRSMTDGDAELEKALFEEFFSSFEAGIAVLQSGGAAEVWRTQAHALKGIALNLGAVALGDLCKKAQEEHLAAPEVKSAIVQAIEREYASAKQYLLGLGAP